MIEAGVKTYIDQLFALKQKNKMLILVNPPVIKKENKIFLKVKRIPLNLCILGTITKNSKIKTKILDARNKELNLKESLDWVKRNKPEYIAISLMIETIKDSILFIKEIKKNIPQIKVIVGGPYLSTNKSIVSKEYIDYGFIGEVNKQIVDLIKGKNKKDISGLIYKDKRKVKYNKQLKKIKLDDLPIPDYSLLEDFPKLYKPLLNAYKKLPSTIMTTSIGCPYNCYFCHQSTNNNWEKNSVEYVIKHIKIVLAYGVKDIYFYDDILTTPKKRMKEICIRIIKEKLDFNWSCYSRSDCVDEELLKLMKNAGCWQISYGFESGSEKVLKILNKRINLKQIKESVIQTKKAGIRVRGFFMIGNPGETKKDIEKTKNLIQKLKLDDIFIDYFTPMTHTKLYNTKNEYGTQIKPNSTQEVSYLPVGLTKEYLQQQKRKILIKFYFRPKIIIRYIFKSLNPSNIISTANTFVMLIRQLKS